MPNQEQVLENKLTNLVVDDVKCNRCPLWENSVAGSEKYGFIRRAGIYGKGTGLNKLLIVADYPGYQEVKVGSVLVGDAGKLLSQILKDVGIDEYECYMINVVRCKTSNNKTPSAGEQDFCQSLHLNYDKPFPEWTPDYVLLLGAIPLRAVLHLTKITEKRGIFYSNAIFPNAKILPTFHPANILRKPELYPVVKQDIQQIADLIKGNISHTNQEIDRHKIIVDDKLQFLQWMEYLLDTPADLTLAIDIETTGLSYVHDKIASIGITFFREQVYAGFAFLTMPKLQIGGQTVASIDDINWFLDLSDKQSLEFQLLKKVLETHHCVLHNSDFDCKFLWKQGIEILDYDDTLDMHYILNEEPPHGLKHLVTIYYPKGSGYQQQMYDALEEDGSGRYDQVSSRTLLNYNIDDTHYTHILYEIFKNKLFEEQLDEFYYKHAMPLKKAISKMTYRGVKMDRNKIMELAAEYRVTIKTKQEELFDTLKLRFNYGSANQLRKVLYTDLSMPVLKRTEKGSPSTDKETLEALAQQSPVVNLIVELRHMRKMCATYLDGDDGVRDKDFQIDFKDSDDQTEDEKPTGKGILQYLDEYDRCHTHLLTHGTTSGRLASRRPSLLNIPRNKEFRHCFIAEPGWQLIQLDYSQAELVMLAYLSGDPGFIEAVTSSDLHTAVCRTLMNIPADQEISKDQRTIAKNINFRIAYGGGHKGLAEMIKISEEEAAEWYRKWNTSYPLASWWMSNQSNVWQENGYIETVYGRRRRFPNLQLLQSNKLNGNQLISYYNRLAINHPCQSAVADTINRTLFLYDQFINRVFGWTHDPKLLYKKPGAVLTIHDCIMTECPEDLVEDMVKILTTMAALPIPKLNISLKYDYKTGTCWDL